ncbi:hypothetical protein SAMN05216525_13915 [Bradyrhizobium sp. Gha]|nr:hypothetical protein SAMN05216525_13915 [Bradyrhizobium sp. Gha]
MTRYSETKHPSALRTDSERSILESLQPKSLW